MIVTRIRKRQRAWWWTHDYYRPREWYGPLPSREDAERAAHDWVMDVASAPNICGPGPDGWVFDHYEPLREGHNSICTFDVEGDYCAASASWKRVESGRPGSSRHSPLCDAHYAEDSKIAVL